MSSGVAKRQRRKLHRQADVPKRHDLAALKTARRAQHQLAGAQAQVMAKRALDAGLSRELLDLKVKHTAVLRTVTDLKWALALSLFCLAVAISMLVAMVITQ